jgi:hypothetical protein
VFPISLIISLFDMCHFHLFILFLCCYNNLHPQCFKNLSVVYIAIILHKINCVVGVGSHGSSR